eukprot:SAG11_NODE_2418_length_3381_cov_136.529555_3_plen_451_part_01
MEVKNKYISNNMTTNIDDGSIVNLKSKRYRAYDVIADRDVTFTNPYGRVAKRIYRQYIELGYDPSMIVIPRDLKYYPGSDRFRKVKSPVPKTPYDANMSISERSTFKKFLASYSLVNSTNVQAYAGIELINNFKPKLESMMNLHKGIKFHFDVNCLMVKYLDGDVITKDSRWVVSRMEQANNIDELNAKVQSSIDLIKTKIPELEARNGSFWKFKKVLSIDLHIGRYKPLKGSSYVPLPKALTLKKAVINVKNDDNECFKWAILSALYTPSHHLERVSHYKRIDKEVEHGLKFTQFPMPITDIKKFENNNDISINVYGFEKAPYVIQKSDAKKSKHINLLLHEGHYCWIKNFSRFCGEDKTHGKRKTHYCDHCLQGFTNQEALGTHLTMGCASITTCKPCMPRKDEAFVQFKNAHKKIKAPYVIYADFECLTEPIQKCNKNPNESSTQAYQ